MSHLDTGRKSASGSCLDWGLIVRLLHLLVRCLFIDGQQEAMLAHSANQAYLSCRLAGPSHIGKASGAMVFKLLK
jgi:hypothetical protein